MEEGLGKGIAEEEASASSLWYLDKRTIDGLNNSVY